MEYGSLFPYACYSYSNLTLFLSSSGICTKFQILDNDGNNLRSTLNFMGLNIRGDVKLTQESIKITVVGTGFTATTIFELVSTTGAIIVPNSITLNSGTSVTLNVTATAGNYYVRIENDSGLATRSTNADLTVSQAPSFSTAAGTLGSFAAGAAVNVAITASSDSAVDFSKVSGTFPGGLSLGSTQNTVYLAGTESGASATTTYNFTIRATDQESQTADRAFSMTINVGLDESMRFL